MSAYSHLSREELEEMLREAESQKKQAIAPKDDGRGGEAGEADSDADNNNDDEKENNAGAGGRKDDRKRSYKAILEEGSRVPNNLPSNLVKQDHTALKKFLTGITTDTVIDYYQQLKDAGCFGASFEKGLDHFKKVDLLKEVPDKLKRAKLTKLNYTFPMIPLGKCGNILAFASKTVIRKLGDSELLSEGYGIKVKLDETTRTNKRGKIVKRLAHAKLTAARGTSIIIDRNTAREMVRYCCRSMKNEIGKISKKVIKIYNELEFSGESQVSYNAYVQKVQAEAKKQAKIGQKQPAPKRPVANERNDEEETRKQRGDYLGIGDESEGGESVPSSEKGISAPASNSKGSSVPSEKSVQRSAAKKKRVIPSSSEESEEESDCSSKKGSVNSSSNLGRSASSSTSKRSMKMPAAKKKRTVVSSEEESDEEVEYADNEEHYEEKVPEKVTKRNSRARYMNFSNMDDE